MTTGSLRSTQHQQSLYLTVTVLLSSAAIGALVRRYGLSTYLALLQLCLRRTKLLSHLLRTLSSRRPRAHRSGWWCTTTPAWEHQRCPPSLRLSTSLDSRCRDSPPTWCDVSLRPPRPHPKGTWTSFHKESEAQNQANLSQWYYSAGDILPLRFFRFFKV